MADSGSGTQAERRGGGAKAVGAVARGVVRPALGRRGFSAASVITDWPEIVGTLLAAQTCPVRIAFRRGQRGEGTLHLRVASSALAPEVQHLAPLIIERINTHFGYRAVAALKITAGPLPPRPTRPAPPPPGPLAGPLRAALEDVDDPELRDVLERLARRLKE